MLALLLAGAASPQYPDIAFDLIAMGMADQEARFRMIRTMSEPNSPMTRIASADVMREDRENTERLRAIVEQIGWPTVSKVGREASNVAWLLAQHADARRDLQAKWLGMMTPYLGTGEVSDSNYAYLWDRVAVGQGRRQRFGTQMRAENGRWVPMPVEDPARLDARRRRMGLPPMAEYIKMMEEAYGAPPSD
jgi:hypothetical protein